MFVLSQHLHLSLMFRSLYFLYTDTSIEAPPSVWPQKHYCDITGLEVGPMPLFAFSILTSYDSWFQAPYTDPATGLRYHDKSVYDVIKNLVCIIKL